LHKNQKTPPPASARWNLYNIMSTYIALQDLEAEGSRTKSIVLEKSSGGIKLSSSKFINCCVQIADYSKGFNVHVLNSNGDVVTENLLKFEKNHKPKVFAGNKRSEFGIQIRCSSHTEKCFYFIVVSWITESRNRVKFLVSCALAAYTKLNVFDQSLDSCSYVSTNCFDFDLKVDANDQLDIASYADFLAIQITCFDNRYYIVHQDTSLVLSNQRNAVSAATSDIRHMEDTMSTCLPITFNDSYSAVFSFVQSFRVNKKAATGNLFILQTCISDLQTPLSSREGINMEFDTGITRPTGRNTVR
jgi:hypothetical protein